jgi:serpin B
MMKKVISMMGIFFLFTSISFSQNQKPLINGQSSTNGTQSISDSLNQFAFDIYKKINPPNENSLFSPFSVSSLLGFLVEASSLNTKQQLMDLLHLNQTSVDEIAKNISQLNLDLYNNNKDSLQIANAFFADKNFTYKQSFIDVFEDVQFVNFEVLDFKNHAEVARETINQFVSDKTNGTIQNLFPQGSISSNDVLVLVNAIYFKGRWKASFPENETISRAFYLDDNSKIDVQTMHANGEYLYFENADLQVLALPYENSTLVMYVFLPKEKGHLKNIENKYLTTTALNQLQKQLKVEQNLSVYLPKFKAQSFFNDLDVTIKQMGLTDAFDLNKANFSNLTDAKFAISKIIQQAKIEVDEEGTLAAAATGIVGVTSVEGPSTPPKMFDANHPFLFLLYDTSGKIILFMGHLINPLK